MDYKTAYEIQRRAYERLLKLAIRAAVQGPGRRDRHTSTAGIPWDVLEGMMDELDALGIKWRELRPDGGKKLPKKDATPPEPKKLDGNGDVPSYEEEPDPSLGAGGSVEAYRG